MSRAKYIQKQLIREEQKINSLTGTLRKLEKMGWVYMAAKVYQEIIHHNGRRRFFLKDLLKVQLKEFNYEE